MPVLKALQRDERRASCQVVLASDGEAAEHLRFVNEQGLGHMPYVLSTELGMGYRVSRLPYAVLLDRGGMVAAKGLVNSREQLDSLLNAHDMGTHRPSSSTSTSKPPEGVTPCELVLRLDRPLHAACRAPGGAPATAGAASSRGWVR
jgi:hypothetical protein